jgi:hypothetical protein
MKTLLGTVAAAALVLGISGAAFAHGNGDDNYGNGGNYNNDPATTGAAVALALQGNESEHNWAISFDSDATNTISGSFGSASGAFNVGQNSGANSVVSNDTAVASMVNGQNLDTGLAIAVAGSGAESERNLAVGICDTASNTITGSFGSASGAFSISQNAGANSVVQGTMAVGTLTH